MWPAMLADVLRDKATLNGDGALTNKQRRRDREAVARYKAASATNADFLPTCAAGFHLAPPAEDPFWASAADEVNGHRGAHEFWEAADATLASRSGLECYPRSPAALAELASELELIDVVGVLAPTPAHARARAHACRCAYVPQTEVMPGKLFLGDLSARQSELALSILKVDRLLIVSPSCAPNATWPKDGRTFHSVTPLQPIAAQLGPAVAFLR